MRRFWKEQELVDMKFLFEDFITELQEAIDLSDIPEITDFSEGHLRNSKT